MTNYHDHIAQWRDREERMKQRFPVDTRQQQNKVLWHLHTIDKPINTTNKQDKIVTAGCLVIIAFVIGIIAWNCR
jgi:hypothetical protein